MATKILVEKGVYNLSNIQDLKDLEEEILLLKLSLRKEEDELEEHLAKLPHHGLKSVADNLLPSFLNKIIANGTWKILLSSLTMFANPFSRGIGFKKTILGSAKKLGVMALLKGAYNYWSNKKSAKNKPVAELKKPSAVTTLKTKNFRKD